jgi:type III secretory pathway component EscS
MNWLAYLALACVVLLPVLRPPWSLGVAVASAVCGLLSALLRNWATVEKATSTFLAKVVVIVVGVAALVVSPWIANTLLSETTLMRPSAFPNAYSAFQYMATLVLWAVLGYCALFFSAIYNVLQNLRGVFSGSPSYAYIEQLFPAERSVKAEIFSSLGRLAGLVVLLVYIAPMLFKEVNYDSGTVLSRLVVATSFVENGGQSTGYSSTAPNLPADCRRLAGEAKLDLTRAYTCSAQTVHCSNIDRKAMITYLGDKDDVVVAKDVDRMSALYELNPVRFDVMKCDAANRYDYRVSQ